MKHRQQFLQDERWSGGGLDFFIVIMIQSSPNHSKKTEENRLKHFCTDTISKPLQVPFRTSHLFHLFLSHQLFYLCSLFLFVLAFFYYTVICPHISLIPLLFLPVLLFFPPMCPPTPEDQTTDTTQCKGWIYPLHMTTVALSLDSRAPVSTTCGMHMLIWFPECTSKVSLIWFVILLRSPSVAVWLAEASCREKGKIASTEELTEEGMADNHI